MGGKKPEAKKTVAYRPGTTDRALALILGLPNGAISQERGG